MKLGTQGDTFLAGPGVNAPSYPSLYLEGKEADGVCGDCKVGDTFDISGKARVASISQRSGSGRTVSLEIMELECEEPPDLTAGGMYPTMKKG